MAAASPVALILGAGPKVGQSVGRTFAAQGYKIALSSRSANPKDDTNDQIHVPCDFTDPPSIVKVFDKVKATLGLPSVVVYNASAATSNKDPKNPLAFPLSDFTAALNINTTSPYVAAQQAVLAFEQLPTSASRTFIYTGNILNTVTISAPFMVLGLGKSASAHFIGTAAKTYADRGFKFYYADERETNGKPMYQGVDGPAAAEHYLQLAQSEKQGPWLQTFVKGEGYKIWEIPVLQ